MNNDIEDLINALPDNYDFVPDEDLFRATFFNLNADGDFNEAYRLFILRYTDDQGKATPEGIGVISFKYLCIKYKQYLNWWESTYSDKDPKFIAKVERLSTPEGFFSDMLYNKIFKVTKQAREYYIFGTHTNETLRKKLRIFKTKYLKQEVSEIPEPVKQEPIKPKEDEGTPF